MSHYIKNVKLAEKFPSHVDSAPTTPSYKARLRYGEKNMRKKL
jgi:hypothetical protein